MHGALAMPPVASFRASVGSGLLRISTSGGFEILTQLISALVVCEEGRYPFSPKPQRELTPTTEYLTTITNRMRATTRTPR